MKHSDPLTLGISLGDISGIGPEVVARALAQLLVHGPGSADGPGGGPVNTRYIVFGDDGAWRRLSRWLPGLDPAKASSPEWASAIHSLRDRVVFEPVQPGLPLDIPCGDARAARLAVEALHVGIDACLSGRIAGLVTAPVNKAAIVDAGIPFVGQTELLAERSGASSVAMMLLGQDPDGRWLRVSLATTHVALKDVASRLTAESLRSTLHLTLHACRQLGLPRHRVGVCGLNPHAGESGKLGREEISLIAPVIEEFNRANANANAEVVGPLAADALFRMAYQGDFDAVVAMYHDQGLVPLKMVAFDTGVNWTLGLPFVRTSPDHGTAYDRVGTDTASGSSMVAAIRLAEQLGVSKARGLADKPHD